MTDNAPVTRDYHERTKLFPGASTTPRRVEAALVPKQYKRYVNLPSIPLPEPSHSDRTVFEALSGSGYDARPLTLPGLSAVLHYSAGIVRRTTVAGRELAFRAASCTGALYHIELYVVCGDVDGALPAGVYHYDVLSESLRLLRHGDSRRALAEACCDEAIATAAASVVLTSTFWRNAWRYEERAYRHVFWDAGTLLANLLAMAESHDLRPDLRSAFVDADVNALLGIDARREAAVAVVSLGNGDNAPAQAGLPRLNLATERLSAAEIEYPLIWQTHAATALAECAAVSAWRERPAAETPTLPPVPAVDGPALDPTIERRGSARRFSDAGLSADALRTVLAAAQGTRCGDQVLASTLIRPMLILNRVAGVVSGAYSLDAGGLTLLRAGDFASEAAHLALDQAAAVAAVNLYFVASQAEVAAAMGERGYRAVQLEAGVRVGQAYLAASSLGLKATGLTFYDDKVASFFGLDPEDTLVLMLVAFGP